MVEFDIIQKLASKYADKFNGMGGAVRADMETTFENILKEYKEILDSDNGKLNGSAFPKYINVHCDYVPDYEYDWLEDNYYHPFFNDKAMLDFTVDLMTKEVTYDKKNEVIMAQRGYTCNDFYENKFSDSCTYTLMNENKEVLGQYQGYVPNDILPPTNGYGDYLTIDYDPETGKLKNLMNYSKMKFDEFFENCKR